MQPFRALMTGVLFSSLLACSVLAQVAAPAAATLAKDPIDAALDTIWNSTHAEGQSASPSGTELDKARKLLVEERDRSFGKVAALLDNNEIAVRLNGAVILAGMAKAGGSSPELLTALKRCVADSNPGIAHWGVEGIMDNTSFPPEEKVDALARCLDLSRPRPLRVAAALAATSAKVKQAAPAIIMYLESIKGDYRKQVDTALTPERDTRVNLGAGGAAPTANRPTYSIVGGGAPAGGAPGAVGGAAPRGLIGGGAPGGTIGGGAPGGIIGGGAKRLPAGGIAGGGVAPGGGIMGRAGGGAMPGPGGIIGPGQQPRAVGPIGPNAANQERIAALAPLQPVDPSKLTPQEQEQIIIELENLPTVQELHHVGIALDGLMKLSLPEAKKTFEFETTPPWALDTCVDEAVKWLAENEALFKPVAAAPAPVAPAPEKAAEGAAPAVDAEP